MGHSGGGKASDNIAVLGKKSHAVLEKWLENVCPVVQVTVFQIAAGRGQRLAVVWCGSCCSLSPSKGAISFSVY